MLRVCLSVVSFNSTKRGSSAVAKWLRDASCLSVVSFNSTKRGVQSFIVNYAARHLSLHALSVVFGIMLRLLVINISLSFPDINTAAYYQPQVSQLVGRSSGGIVLTTPGLLQR